MRLIGLVALLLACSIVPAFATGRFDDNRNKLIKTADAGANTSAQAAGDPQTGLSGPQLAIYNQLVSSGRQFFGINFDVSPAQGNANPKAGLAEVSFPITLSSLNIKGEIVFRFYASAGDATTYLGQGEDAPFVNEATQDSGGNVYYGTSSGQSGGSQINYRVAYSTNDNGGMTWLRVAGQGLDALDSALGGGSPTDGVIEIGTFQVPEQNSEVSQQTLDNIVGQMTIIYGAVLQTAKTFISN